MTSNQRTYNAARLILLVLIAGVLCYVLAFSTPLDQLRWSLQPKPTLASLTATIHRQQADLVSNELTAASLARQTGELDQAVAWYRAAIAISPSSTSYIALITILIDQQSIPQATVALEDALRRFPENVSLLQLQGDLSEAR